MPIKLLMPALSPTMTEGKLSKWVKQEGDVVKSGDIVAEIETDKAIMEYEATEEGVLGKILVAEGTEGVKVNDLIGVILEDGEDNSVIDSFVQSASSTSPAPSAAPQPEAKKEAPASQSQAQATSSTPASGAKVFITPLAKKIASLNNIDVSKVKGTGPKGRIIKHDIEAFMSSGGASASSQPSYGLIETSAPYEDKPNSGMRKVIASRLLESKTTIPHYYLTIDCNMEQVLEARVSLNNAAKDKYKISVNDFIIKAVSLAMQDVPEANSSWMGDVTRYFTRSDVAVAVATPTGLFTPIIKSADHKGLASISNEMKELAKKAKEGKLKPEEYQGGGFSISNLGMMGIREFCAIVNPPHAGILAIGATEQRPIVKNSEILIANMMTVTLSADHRIMDGAVGAKFLNAFKGYIENPVSMII